MIGQLLASYSLDAPRGSLGCRQKEFLPLLNRNYKSSEMTAVMTSYTSTLLSSRSNRVPSALRKKNPPLVIIFPLC